MAAAVGDFKPAKINKQKIKKDQAELKLDLVPNPDILATLSQEKKKDQIIVGFALETENEIDHASNKLKKKKIDLIILNSLSDNGAGFGTGTNKITILDKSGKVKEYGLKSKEEVAADIVDFINTMIEVSQR